MTNKERSREYSGVALHISRIPCPYVNISFVSLNCRFADWLHFVIAVISQISRFYLRLDEVLFRELPERL